jgi:hypothetical protein
MYNIYFVQAAHLSQGSRNIVRELLIVNMKPKNIKLTRIEIC